MMTLGGFPFEVGAGLGSVVASRLVEHRNVRRDIAVDHPSQNRLGFKGSVSDQPFRGQVELVINPVQHRLGRSDLGLPD